MFKITSTEYIFRLQLALVITLFFLIIIFYFWPRWDTKVSSFPTPAHIVIKLTNIPRTEQTRKKLSPPPARPEIPIPDSELEMTDYVDILLESTGIDSSLKVPGSINFNAHPLLLLPRQIFEILPSSNAVCNGEITLLLQIGTNGKVVSHKVLKNNTLNEACLAATLKAIEGSQWESAIIEGEAVEYWINKTYKFEK